jgi:hypothetical protein
MTTGPNLLRLYTTAVHVFYLFEKKRKYQLMNNNLHFEVVLSLRLQQQHQ